MKHFIDIQDCTREEIMHLLSLAETIRAEIKSGVFRSDLKKKTVGLIFQKPSNRTRVSFEVGVAQLGGRCLGFQPQEIDLGRREPVKDVSRVLSRFLDMVMIRTFSHQDIQEFAAYSSIPVINGLSDYSHPCQALADALTIRDAFPGQDPIRVAYLGDPNNVCRSLVEICSICGFEIIVSSPEPAVFEGQDYHYEKDPQKAVRGAHVIYTDTWISMGEENAEKKVEKLEPYQVNMALMNLAHKDAIFMHCLPAHRGEEVTDEVIEMDKSRVFDQAENRLHAQKAVLTTLSDGLIKGV